MHFQKRKLPEYTKSNNSLFPNMTTKVFIKSCILYNICKNTRPEPTIINCPNNLSIFLFQEETILSIPPSNSPQKQFPHAFRWLTKQLFQDKQQFSVYKIEKG
jgi:hypothetical protein